MRKSCAALLAALSLAGFAALAQGQYAYPAYGGYPYNGPPAPPPAWSYDPYTSGIAACPQWSPWDPRECTTLVPSYGQPSLSPWAEPW